MQQPTTGASVGRRSQAAQAKGRVTISRDDVVAAGAALLDRDGVEQLSMRKLAVELNISVSTLYWHVRDRNDLLGFILDDTVRHVRAPDTGTWDERLVALLADTRSALLPRPALVSVIWRAGWHLGLETLRIADEAVGLTAASGLPDEDVNEAYVAFVVYLFGFIFAETETAGRTFGDEPGDVTVAANFTNLARYGPGTAPDTMDRTFYKGLKRLVAGVKHDVEGAA